MSYYCVLSGCFSVLNAPLFSRLFIREVVRFFPSYGAKLKLTPRKLTRECNTCELVKTDQNIQETYFYEKNGNLVEK